MILYFRRDFDPLTAEDRGDPLCCPATLRWIINRGKRLKLNEFRGFAREHTADVMPIATHGDGGCAYRTSKIERKDLGIRIASELERHQRQQHRLAGTRWPDHQCMTDIADVKRKAKRGRSLRPGQEQGRRLEMVVPRLPGPHC